MVLEFEHHYCSKLKNLYNAYYGIMKCIALTV